MSAGRIILIAILLIFGLPFLGTLAFNIVAAGFAVKVAGNIIASEKKSNELNSSEFDGRKVVGVNKTGLYSLRHFSEIDDERTVQLNIQMDMSNIRGQNDNLPTSESATAAYVAARMPELALAECAMITAAFADKCVVNHVSSRPSGRLHNVRMTLAFIQRDAFGSLPDRKEINYINLPMNLTPGERTAILPDAWTSARGKYYNEIANSCARVRKENGNCAIQSVSISSSPDRKSSALIVEARTNFAVLK